MMTPTAQSTATVSGSQAFLQQAHRNNWQRYLAQLSPGTTTRPLASWDYCILTAGNARQAEMVEHQLEMRRCAGLLPATTRFCVVADPEGLRIGSGGATLRILAALAGVGDAPLPDLAQLRDADITHNRILVIHSGGDSRRLPHCSATGKLFARIPRVLPDGRASTIFDEFLINLSGVAEQAAPGVLLVAGDVLLLFDHLQLSLRRHGVTGVAVAAPAAMGSRHGVYVGASTSQGRAAFLHKADPTTLVAAGAIDGDGNVQIDTGLVWLDVGAVRQMAALTALPAVAALCGLPQPNAAHLRANTPLNLYGDLLLPLADNTEQADYLLDAGDGPATPGLQAARQLIWPHLRGLPFGVARLQPAVFVHFGTSEEYWRMVVADPSLAQTCDWMRCVAAWPIATQNPARASHVAVNAALGPLGPDLQTGAVAGDTLLMVDSHLLHPPQTQGPAIIARVQSRHPLALQADTVLDQLPVAQGYVTRLFGLRDDPKRRYPHPDATYLNQPWQTWLGRWNGDPALIWPGLPAEERTLWHAQLFPIAADREQSLALTLPLQDPAHAPPGWQAAWQAAPRLSLASSFAQTDSRRLLNDIAALEDHIAATHLLDAVIQARPVAEMRSHVEAWDPTLRTPRLHLLQEWIGVLSPWRQIRGYKALAELHQDHRWDDKAFQVLAQMIEADTRRRMASLAAAPRPATRTEQSVRVQAAARIDFGGGWTDTPPYSLEAGGRVLNAAMTLRGRHPIVAEATWLDDTRLLLDSRDIDETLEPQWAGEVLAYADPADPFALLKAALVMQGIVPLGTPPQTPIAHLLRPLGRGLRLATQTSIPRGSGLGTSSIMAGAVLAALGHLLERPPAEAELFDQVLCLEQMLTTGGGWQDQVGGLVGGIHLVRSAPGLPQQLHVQPATLDPQTSAELAARLVLVYTGQQRLAKNLLRTVMGRWMARDPEMTACLVGIGDLAEQMHTALQRGDVDTFGTLIGEHWRINQRMDPGCTNPFINDLFDHMQPVMLGAKLAGAGGGGFAIVVTKSRDAVAELHARLVACYAGTSVALWPSAVAQDGLVISRH